jgi:mono/diheme cytochrome c family protein
MSRRIVRRIAAFSIALAANLGASLVRAEAPLERGKYLVGIMDCTGCHTTGALAGQPDPAKFLAGSDIGFEIPGLGIFYPPNLTGDVDSGLGSWSAEDIVTLLRTGARPDGCEVAPIMPWRSYSTLTDADVQAVAAYLKSLPAVSHAAPQLVGPGEKASAPYMTVAMPN